jgi:alpha/beta superfamily hydrolase
MDLASYRARLPDLIKGACAGAAVAILVGFQWGGWVLGSTATQAASDADQSAIVRVLAPICADRFQHSADVGANLAALMKADSWDRDDIITKAGWVTFPGSGPDPKVADACVALLSQKK